MGDTVKRTGQIAHQRAESRERCGGSLGQAAALRVQIPNVYSFVFRSLASSLDYTCYKMYLDGEHEDYRQPGWGVSNRHYKFPRDYLLWLLQLYGLAIQ